MTDERFTEAFNLVEPFIERRYGIPIVITDVKDPFTGDLDGAEIRVDYDLVGEEALFILVHLFGHTVQWNLSERAREIGTLPVTNASEELLTELREYEKEACAYSLQLFHEAGVRDLDQWISDFAACDIAYLMNFYRTGEQRPFRSFWRDGQPAVMPKAIPEFHPAKWVSRWDGVVI